MFLTIVNKIEEWIISLFLVTCTLLVFIDVVMRFGFGKAWIWSQELTLHLSAWMVLFGASYCLKLGAHIGMDAFVKIFPPIGRRILTGIGCILSLIYCWLVIYGAWIYLGKVKKLGISLEDLRFIPTWVAHGILLVGFVFLGIRLLILLWSVAFGETEVFRHADEAKESMAIVEELRKEGTV
ncbi:MAG: TRAP transporter small permease [Desulfofustis sp.]|nr:TRAP transporter small permease [Desulfofustis sp.]